MGRPSKLTEAQWIEVQRRLLEGESRTALAREFKISEGAIRQRVTTSVEKIKSVANQIVATEKALAEMPVSTRAVTRSYAERLMSIGENMLAGADHAAANFHRLSALAGSELAKVDDADPMQSAEHLKSHMVLTKAANEAAQTPINLLAANKDRMKSLSDDPPEGAPKLGSMDPTEAARAYQAFMAR